MDGPIEGLEYRKEKKMNYVFDIDGTICSKSDGDYSKAQPFQERIDHINNLYDMGHTIVFHTARGMGRTGNDPVTAIEMFYDYTRDQLNFWGVKYHELFLGKPSGDIYIDDKGMMDDDYFNN